MQHEERDNFLRDLAEKIQDIDLVFEDHGIASPIIDCAEEDCDLPDDHDIITLRNLLAEANVILDKHMV